MGSDNRLIEWEPPKKIETDKRMINIVLGIFVSAYFVRQTPMTGVKIVFEQVLFAKLLFWEK